MGFNLNSMVLLVKPYGFWDLSSMAFSRVWRMALANMHWRRAESISYSQFSVCELTLNSYCFQNELKMQWFGLRAFRFEGIWWKFTRYFCFIVYWGQYAEESVARGCPSMWEAFDALFVINFKILSLLCKYVWLLPVMLFN